MGNEPFSNPMTDYGYLILVFQIIAVICIIVLVLLWKSESVKDKIFGGIFLVIAAIVSFQPLYPKSTETRYRIGIRHKEIKFEINVPNKERIFYVMPIKKFKELAEIHFNDIVVKEDMELWAFEWHKDKEYGTRKLKEYMEEYEKERQRRIIEYFKK